MVTVGIDEVGRGCWAGPLVTGAVVMSKPIFGITDSKQLDKQRRIKLAEQIKHQAEACSLGWVWPKEIDELGLTKATALAMRRCLAEIQCPYDEVVIDGKFNFLVDNPKCKTQIGADRNVPCVSAASIIAKVARDKYMHKLSLDYPVYGFDKHVGYGTKMHITMLKKHGVSQVHRQSYKPIAGLLK